ncbi:MAG: hypothetical protein KGZ58_08485, partial [Ignavibacteriales bacterium]|nr:hypothetical protein [Ignavibacteriales bacterium]
MKNLFLILTIAFFFCGCKKETTTETKPPTKPVVKILSPKNNDAILDSTIIEVSATDDKGIVKVEIYIDNTLDSNRVFVVSPYRWAWNTQELQDSSVHTIYAKAYDGDGNVSSTQVLTVTTYWGLPTNLSAFFSSETTAVLTWEDICRIETGFEIEKRINDSTFKKVKDVEPNSTTTNIKGIYLSTSTYSFRIRAIKGLTKSKFSNIATTILAFPNPSNLTITSISDTTVTLQWQDDNNFESKFLIEQSNDGNNFILIDSTNANITTKSIHTTFILNSAYYFRVKAKSKLNESNYSNTAQTTFILPEPTNLNVTSITETTLSLQWQDNSNFETGFLIEQKEDNNSFQLIDSTSFNTTAKNINGIFLTQHTYSYRVRAKSNLGFSNYSNTAQTTLQFPAPSNLTITSFLETSISLRWQDNSSFETGFLVERSINGSNYDSVGITTANVNTISLQDAYYTTNTYRFRTKAFSNLNRSDYSNVVLGTVNFPKPTNLTVVSVSDTSISLQWQDNSSFETEFLIEQSINDSNNFTLVKTVGANTTSTSLAGTFLSTNSYYFKVRAKTNINYSDYSNIVVATHTFIKTFGGSGDDGGNSVLQAGDGEFIIAGSTYTDVYLIKADGNGNQVWARTFGGNSGWASSVQPTNDGGFIMCGTTGGGGWRNIYLVKTDGDGNQVFAKTFGGNSNNYGSSAQQTNDGGFVIVGVRYFDPVDSDVYLIKTNSNGDEIWTKTFGGSEPDQGYSIQQTADGGFIIVGSTSSYGAGGNDVYLIKTDENGNALFSKTFGGGSNDYGYSVQVTSDGGFIVCGSTQSFGTGKVYLIKTNGNGGQTWAKTLG